MTERTAARRTRIGWILLAVMVLGTLGWALWPRSGPESVGAHTRRLAREFRCVDCEGLSVAESATASARAARADIRRRIAAGESDADIRAVFVARYGESVLLNPQGRGIGLLVWALPVLLLVLGAAGITATVRRGRRTPRLAATAEDEAIVARARDTGDPR